MDRDRDDYILETERHLKDENIYRLFTFNKKLIVDLTECKGSFVWKKHWTIIVSSTEGHECKLRKLYLLSKTHKRLCDVPRQPEISNYGTPTTKASEFLDNHLNLSCNVAGLILGI